MQFPQININGTSGTELLEQIEEARVKVQEAREAVGEAVPNGRDYQTLPLEAYSQARVEHRARLQALSQVENELAAISRNIAEQIETRRKQRA